MGEKAETYAELMVRLKKAIAAGFWFEAVMIEYAIMEDRTSSILFHSCVLGEDAYSDKRMLHNKLKSISFQIGKQHPILSMKINPDLIDAVDNWRDVRNDTVHRACQRRYDEAEMSTLAKQGQELTRLLVNASRRVTNAAQKAEKEHTS